MDCPCCCKPLIVVERNNIEVEYCADCGGFFLNNDEWLLIKKKLNLPFETTDIMAISDVVETKREEARLCPQCGYAMEKIDVDNILLDRCVNGCGVWFDKGELSVYMNTNAINSDKNEIVCFLGENFIRPAC